MKISLSFQDFKDITTRLYHHFFDDNIFKLSASLAYYTILAISPIIIIIISSASILYKKQAIENKIYTTLNDIIGHDLASEVQNFVLNSSLSGKSDIALYSGLIVLFVASTAVFANLQDSLNFIWKVKAVPKRGWLKIIRDRVLSFFIIVILGIILLSSILFNAFITTIGHYLFELIPGYEIQDDIFLYVVNKILMFLVSTLIFLLIFKILPDIKIKWKPAIIGSIFTTILFTIGHYLIGYYLEQFKPGLNFGSASSVVVLLIWVYYSAMIIFIGAEFTQIYAEKYFSGIQPSDQAVHLKISVEEKEN